MALDLRSVAGAVAQLVCMLVVGRQIIGRLSWRARLRWIAISIVVYVATLLVFFRLVAAATAAVLILQALMAARDRRWGLRIRALGKSLDLRQFRKAMNNQLAQRLRGSAFNWVTIVLVVAFVAFRIWEPPDRIVLPYISSVISTPTRYVSPWWLVADSLLLAVIMLLVEAENTIQDFCYAVSFVASGFFALLLLSARPCFSGLVIFLAALALSYLSKLKLRRTGTNLHAYDFLYILRNCAAVTFWLKTERSDALPLMLMAFLGILLVCLIGFSEPAEIDRRLAAAALLVALGAIGAAKCVMVPRPYWFSLREQMSFAIFIGTIAESFHAHRSQGVLRMQAPPLPSKLIKSNSMNQNIRNVERARPTIIFIMNESTFPPSLYFPANGNEDPVEFFQSSDARRYGLRVEVFGGPTWMTEFSVLTGIPSSCYGSFGTDVFHLATNRIHHSLPQYLKMYGYRTGFICPTYKEFVGGDRFYASIGFEEIRDARTFNAPSEREADSFYLSRGLDWLSDHFAGGNGAAFLYILTMSNHYPHSAPDSEFDEYIRRFHQTCRDYVDFRAELVKRFPNREFLIVHCGDHQPPFTARLQRGSASSPEAGHGDWFPREEIAYRTYFALQGVNFQPLIEPNLPELIEPAYLSTVVLAAAGIPLDDLHLFRYELMKRHDGRLFFADSDGTIAAQLNHQMMECGLISKH